MTAPATQATTMRRATADDVSTIAGWHPIETSEVLGWWEDDEAEPWVMTAADGELVAYGELWLDPEEDEVELARLIVAPELRGRGYGGRLTRELTAKAATTGLSLTMLRVEPDNAVAIGCYLANGFVHLGAEESAVWNEGQRRAWTWMTYQREDAR